MPTTEAPCPGPEHHHDTLYACLQVRTSRPTTLKCQFQMRMHACSSPTAVQAATEAVLANEPTLTRPLAAGFLAHMRVEAPQAGPPYQLSNTYMLLDRYFPHRRQQPRTQCLISTLLQPKTGLQLSIRSGVTSPKLVGCTRPHKQAARDVTAHIQLTHTCPSPRHLSPVSTCRTDPSATRTPHH